MRFLVRWAVFLIIAAFLAGCAAGAGQRTSDLLTQDHQGMTDTELQAYYQSLSDQLARESRAARTAGRVGYGAGTFGVGATRGMADEEQVQELRERWNEVRREMRTRGLLP